jgi:hypothetical protein
MSRYISFTKLKHLIFLNEGSITQWSCAEGFIGNSPVYAPAWLHLHPQDLGFLFSLASLFPCISSEHQPPPTSWTTSLAQPHHSSPPYTTHLENLSTRAALSFVSSTVPQPLHWHSPYQIYIMYSLFHNTWPAASWPPVCPAPDLLHRHSCPPREAIIYRPDLLPHCR